MSKEVDPSVIDLTTPPPRSEVLPNWSWEKIQELLDLIILKKAAFTSNRGKIERCKENGKIYQRIHLLYARLVIKDLKKAWLIGGKFGKFRDYYTERRNKGRDDIE